MRIRHNINAAGASRCLKGTNTRQGSNIEKLSSGLRINRAGDDAAGLSISEKMRSQLRGLNQGSQNAQDGISLLQTAEGAMNEIHSMLQRLKTLSVQSANGTYTDSDRALIEKEVKELVNEVSRIANNTEFNGMKLLDGSFSEDATTAAGSSSSPYILGSLVSSNSSASHRSNDEVMTLDDVLNDNTHGLNIIYSTDDFTTTSSPSFQSPSTISGYDTLKNTLQTQIVPQAVKSIINKYSSAFNYLSDSSIGIGLRLYDADTDVLASVSMGYSYNTSNNNVIDNMLTYQLSVNMHSLNFNSDGSLTDSSRKSLEATIAHEMVHGLMDEALTNGMIGINNGTLDSSNAFPKWFKEGMAQTAAGGYDNTSDWVNAGLGITASTSIDDIKASLRYIGYDSQGNDISHSLTHQTGYSSYGTGYLACMYLGYLASGSGSINSTSIASGVNTILGKLVEGNSLNSVINEISGGMFTSIADFENNFASRGAEFVHDLTVAVGNSGNGSLLTNSLTDDDILSNSSLSGVNLFKLDTTHETVQNIYPNDVNVLSGGGSNVAGTSPSDVNIPSVGAGSTIDISNPQSIQGVTYDPTTGDISITQDGTYTFTGTSATNMNILVRNNVNATVILDNFHLNGTLQSYYHSRLNVLVRNDCSISDPIHALQTLTSDSKITLGGTGILTLTSDNAATSSNYSAISCASGSPVEINSKDLIVKTITTNPSTQNAYDASQVILTNGIIFDNNHGYANGTVDLNRELNFQNGSFEVKSGTTLNIKSNGKLIGNTDITLDNNSTVNNRGQISNFTGSGTVNHYINNVVKHISEPSTLTAGEALTQPSASTIDVYYNNNQASDTLSGSWKIFDRNNNEITDVSSVTVGADDYYSYQLTFNTGAPSNVNVLFDSENPSSYNNMQYSNEQSSNYSFNYITSEAVNAGSASVANGGRSITYAYGVDTAPASSPTPGGVSPAAPAPSSAQPAGKLKIQLGGKANDNVSFNLESVKAEDLGIDTLSVATRESAKSSITKCDNAINKLSGIRSTLGAYQNRLEHSVSIIDNTEENIQASESRIRDTDMASAMMEHVKNQILIQASQSMLLQANREPEAVLALLS